MFERGLLCVYYLLYFINVNNSKRNQTIVFIHLSLCARKKEEPKKPFSGGKRALMWGYERDIGGIALTIWIAFKYYWIAFIAYLFLSSWFSVSLGTIMYISIVNLGCAYRIVFKGC